MVGFFPNGAAIARLVTAVIVETHDEWAVAERRYLSEESMAKIGTTDDTITLEEPLALTRRSRRSRTTPLRGARSCTSAANRRWSPSR